MSVPQVLAFQRPQSEPTSSPRRSQACACVGGGEAEEEAGTPAEWEGGTCICEPRGSVLGWKGCCHSGGASPATSLKLVGLLQPGDNTPHRASRVGFPDPEAPQRDSRSCCGAGASGGAGATSERRSTLAANAHLQGPMLSA